MYDDFFARAHQLREQGEPFATAIVVRAEKPTSGKPGDKAIITADGTMHGWIGGSCAQPTVIREALNALRTNESRFIRLSPEPQLQPQRDGLNDVPLTCFSGGTLEIYIEPQQPQPRLVVVGNLPVAQALVELGKAMNYQAMIVDLGHQEGMSSQGVRVYGDIHAIRELTTSSTALVVATHGQYDELALEEALRTDALYIGLVASRKRAVAVRDYLTQQGFSAEQIERLASPAGLDIQARRGDEIALSIMAEIVQRRRQASQVATLLAPLQPLVQETIAATAIDPVCGMSVAVADAKYTYEYQGMLYYFCCPGCKTVFRKAPENYIGSHPTPLVSQ